MTLHSPHRVDATGILISLLVFLVVNSRSTVAQLVDYGLPTNGLLKGPIHIGVLPDWSREGPVDINRALGAGVGIVGDYINMSPTDYSASQAQYHMSELLRVTTGSVKAIYAPAVLFSAGLDQWTSAHTAGVVRMCRMVNQQGVPVWLRLLFEMNGYWMSYGLQPELYVAVWRNVTTAVRAQTNNTLMLWSPNIWSGPVDDVQGYTPYWPGQQYVDVAGISFYSGGHNSSVNRPPASGLFQDAFEPYYKMLNPSSLTSRSANPLNLTAPLPVVVSETSAPYYYQIPPGSPYLSQQPDTDIAGNLPNMSTLSPVLASPPYPHSDDELYIKATWFVQLTGNVTAAAFPNLRAVSFFNYFKRATAPVLADFRCVGGNATVEAWFRSWFGNQTAYDLGYTGGAGRQKPVTGWLTFIVTIASLTLLA